ncbi:MAG: DUF362 domain-containing protein, partial [Lamprocystis purpurea]|nr:DUF362 domain-containing protein [Lamprocystis purpurea]
RGDAAYVSVPKLKTNLYTGVTLGFKNAMGVIPYNLRQRHHHYAIDRKLVEMLYLFKPDLVFIDGVVGGEGECPAPVDPVDSRHIADQQRQIRDGPVVHAPAIGVDVLAQQIDLAHALLGQAGDLSEDVVEWPADLLAAGVGDHAVGAVFRAAFHHRDEGAWTVRPRGRKTVELLDLGEGDIHLRLTAGLEVTQHLRQTVQGLGAEHQIHIGRPLANRLALLTCHTTADADHQIRTLELPRTPPAELGEDLFLGFLTDGAGVEQQHVRILGARGEFHPMGLTQHVRHARGVVLVHLAAEGLNVEFLGHKS